MYPQVLGDGGWSYATWLGCLGLMVVRLSFTTHILVFVWPLPGFTLTPPLSYPVRAEQDAFPLMASDCFPELITFVEKKAGT